MSQVEQTEKKPIKIKIKIKKRNYKSKQVQGVAWKELTHIPAKRGSVSGRQHPDITRVEIIFKPAEGNNTICVRAWDFEDDYARAKAHYDYLPL